MKALSQLKIRTKLFLSFGTLVLLLALIGAVSALRIMGINDRITEILHDR